MPTVTRPSTPVGVKARLPLKPSPRGGSGSFLIAAVGGERYWCKVLNNGQSSRVPINEQIVGRLGRLIGVAVCEPMLVYIPATLVGWEFRPGMFLQEGWAHGSAAVSGAVEVYALDDRAADDNARRQAGFFAIYDWLFGSSDIQWLRSTDANDAYSSHDHGHYLRGPDWTRASLQADQAVQWPLGQATAGLSAVELLDIADRLDDVAEQEVVNACSNIPQDWPIADDELEMCVELAMTRKGGVSSRLRALAATV